MAQLTPRAKPVKKLVYLIGTYPLLTTTFIDREITLLRRWGVEMQVVSIRRPPAEIPLSSHQRGLGRDVLYLLPMNILKLVFSQVFYAITRPRAFFGTLFHLLSRPHPGLGPRFKTLLHFGEGVYAAYLLRNQEFHEVHAHFADRAGTVALVMGRLTGRPYSLSIHAAEDIFVHPTLLSEKITEARHAVTCTRYNKTYLEALLGQNLERRITHIPHGLDLGMYRPAPRSPNGNPLILAVGQLAERKGFAHLVEACALLEQGGHDFRCEIVGEGPQRAALEGMIARLGLGGRVALCGALPHEAVIGKYREAALFVLPCVRSADGNLDGIPNVLFEAMAMQLPVITSRLSAIPELVEDGVNGVLVEPGDAAGLARAAAALLGSPQQARRLGRSGRDSVRVGYDLEANVRRFAATLWPEFFKTEEETSEVSPKMP